MAILAATLVVGTSASAESPTSFAREVRALYRTVACAGKAPVPRGMAASLVRRHCRRLTPLLEAYRAHYAWEATAYLGSILPADTATTVVVTSGLDLLGALTAFPSALELTTISGDGVGDPRLVVDLHPSHLDAVRRSVEALTTEKAPLPTRTPLEPLALFLVALATHGYEPVDLKLIRLDPTGEIRYLSDSELPALPRRGRRSGQPVVISMGAEISFVKSGDPSGPRRVHRHILRTQGDDERVAAYLARHRHGAVLAKYAGDTFRTPSVFRDAVLGHAEVVLSDVSGPLPTVSQRFGFHVQTYGHFAAPSVTGPLSGAEEAKELWGRQPERFLPFRFGDVDAARRFHLMVGLKTPPVSQDLPPLFVSSPRDAVVTSTTVTSEEVVEGGRQVRVLTPEGPVRFFVPTSTATEVVFYLHGYFTRVDAAWQEHDLLRQLRESGRKAIFVVPEASTGNDELPFWRKLDALLTVVGQVTGRDVSKLPCVASAHSGGYRTIVYWLSHPGLREIVLLDAFYGADKEFRAWLARGSSRRMVVVSGSTAKKAVAFARRIRGARVLDGLPGESKLRAPSPLLVFRTDVEHMAFIEGGEILAPALALSGLR